MRNFITLVEDAEPFFNSNSIWLHGGKETLEGNHFRRNARHGKDAGGLYFSKDDEQGLQHALGYAVKSGPTGGIWYCKINLSPNQVFDYANETHMEKLQEVMDDKDFDYIYKKGQNWSIVWMSLPSGKTAEEYLLEAGFRAAIVKAKSQGAEPNTFICVFVPGDIEIINFTPKAQLITKPPGAI